MLFYDHIRPLLDPEPAKVGCRGDPSLAEPKVSATNQMHSNDLEACVSVYFVWKNIKSASVLCNYLF